MKKSGRAGRRSPTSRFGFTSTGSGLVERPVRTAMLHLLGIDHERFAFCYRGRDFRLTDVSGHVVRDVLA